MRAARVTATVLAMAGALLVPINASADPLTRPAIEAADTLATLDVKGRAPKTGCDTRNDILRRDLVQKRILPDCTVARGVLKEPYTRQTIRHVAGRSVIDIDHVVSLSDAWQKGEGDAATWLPPNKAYRCSFVARQVAVKARYGLWVTAAEKSAIARVLGTCPAHPLPR